jgi:hypothetical protein
MPRGPIADAPKVDPWKPSKWDVADAAALQALHRGEATEHQQQRALKFVIEVLCGTYDLAYRPTSARDTDFALGKAYVGQQIVKLLHINTSAFKEDPSSGRPPA